MIVRYFLKNTFGNASGDSSTLPVFLINELPIRPESLMFISFLVLIHFFLWFFLSPLYFLILSLSFCPPVCLSVCLWPSDWYLWAFMYIQCHPFAPSFAWRVVQQSLRIYLFLKFQFWVLKFLLNINITVFSDICQSGDLDVPIL